MLVHWIRTFVSVVFAIIFAVILCLPSLGQEQALKKLEQRGNTGASAPVAEKVAVLYFGAEGKSCPGCACLCVWPLSLIFKEEEKQRQGGWNLRSGFRDLLNERLSEGGYNIVEPEYVDRILQEIGKEDTAALASRLGADIMIKGSISKFQQHRNRASSQGPTVLSPQEGMTLVATGGMGGYRYSVSAETTITIYDSSGEELETSEVKSKKTLRDFYMGIGPLTYHRGGPGKKDNGSERESPIVDYDRLDKMEFGTDEFKNRTLFGMAAMDVMDKITAKVEGYLEPTELPSVQGKIIYVGTGKRLKENEVYIDLGAGDGIRHGHKLGVYMEAVPLTDPDTGEELSVLAEEKIGVIKISKVEADHLSIAEIVEKTGQIEKGNIVKPE